MSGGTDRLRWPCGARVRLRTLAQETGVVIDRSGVWTIVQLDESCYDPEADDGTRWVDDDDLEAE